MVTIQGSFAAWAQWQVWVDIARRGYVGKAHQACMSSSSFASSSFAQLPAQMFLVWRLPSRAYGRAFNILMHVALCTNGVMINPSDNNKLIFESSQTIDCFHTFRQVTGRAAFSLFNLAHCFLALGAGLHFHIRIWMVCAHSCLRSNTFGEGLLSPESFMLSQAYRTEQASKSLLVLKFLLCPKMAEGWLGDTLTKQPYISNVLSHMDHVCSPTSRASHTHEGSPRV